MSLRSHWTLDPDTIFLNHGSFGACPRVIQERQQQLRDQMERQPVRFFVREAPAMMADARAEVADFLGADPEGLGFVKNATSGVNAVLRSLNLSPGDELLVSNHEYNACRNVLDFVADRSGAVVRVVSVPFPIADADEVTQAFVSAVTDRTKLALIDHITSQTGLVFPLESIVQQLQDRGVDVLVDGAHAPGMLPLNLRELNAAYYTGNGHKWLCAPKGAAILYVRKDRLDKVRPTVISHGANAPDNGQPRFRHEFDWLGTDDVTAALSLPDAIRFLRDTMPGGFAEIRARNKALVLAGRDKILDVLGCEAPAPDDMIGSLSSIPLPDRADDGPVGAWDIDPIQDALFSDHQIEVPVQAWPKPPKRMIRISAALYNEEAEYTLLANALRELVTRS